MKGITLMNSTKLLMNADRNLCLIDFNLAFRHIQDKGEHLWRQYSVTYSHNLLAFLRYLNDSERESLLSYIWNYMRD